MKKKAIWGAGTYGGRFAGSFNDGEISFFIDSDIRRSGKIYCGKMVRHVSEIAEEEWKNLYVYIPENYKQEILSQINGKGMLEGINYSIYGHNLHISKDKAESGFEGYKSDLKKKATGEIIPIFATFWRKHGYDNFFAHIKCWNQKVLLISEHFASDEDGAALGKISYIRAPLFADSETIIDCEESVDFDDCELECVDETINFMKGFFPNESIEKCRYSVKQKYLFVLYTLCVLNCKQLICFGSVCVEHSILQQICRKKSIQVIYTHPGIIHGTLAFDVGGEMGESIPAIYPKEFDELYLSESDIKKASCVKDFLYHSRLNRKVQPQTDFIQVQSKLKKDRPIVFFAGQNDVGSHMIPYTENTRKYHSPIFESSIEAAVFVAKICERKGWSFIYKPHPMYVHPEEKNMLPPSAHYIDYADINEVIDAADVVVTILSTTNYDAVVRDKPVVVLGYMQSKGKGFNYEAFCKEEIEGAIQKAVQYGMTDEMKRNFIRHLAQCLKYYLYDNGMEREIRYGQPFPDSFDGFFSLYNLLTKKEHT